MSGSSSESGALRVRIVVFDILAFLGIALNLAVLAPTLLSTQVHRRKTWYNLIVSWIIYSCSYLLALGHQTGPEPSFGVCIVQAALVYSTPLLCAVATVCHTVDYSLLASGVILGRNWANRGWNRLLRSLPWIIFVLVFVLVLLLVNDPSRVRRDPNHFYCQINFLAPRLICATIMLVCAAVLLPVEIYTAILLYRHWNAFRRLNIRTSDVGLSTFIRLALFTSIAIIAVGMSTIGVLKISDAAPAWSMILPIIPLLAAIAFGTQRDIFSAYIFCKRRQEDTSSTDNLLVDVEHRVK